jgi:ketosteroid isomerase-like protein
MRPDERAIREVHSTWTHRQARINCISELEDVAAVGEVAYTLSRDSLSVIPRATGEATHLAGHRIAVYRKQAGGRCLLARDAHTLSPAAQLER